MKYYGTRAIEVGQRIVEAFRHPETLPQALAPIFIHRKDDVPCRKWSWHNQLIAAALRHNRRRGFRQWEEAGRKVKKGAKAIWILGPALRTSGRRTILARKSNGASCTDSKAFPYLLSRIRRANPWLLPRTGTTSGSRSFL